MWKSRLCTVKTDSCRRNCWKLWKLSFQGNHLFFLLSVPLQRFEVKAAENAAKVPSRKPGFKIKINGVSLWQRHKPAVPEPTHNKIAKWKLILPSWPGVAPDEVGGWTSVTGEAPTASAVISAPRSHLAGEMDRRLPAAREMTQKIWSFFTATWQFKNTEWGNGCIRLVKWQQADSNIQREFGSASWRKTNKQQQQKKSVYLCNTSAVYAPQ